MPKEEDHKPEKGIIANATEIDILTPPKAAQALPTEAEETNQKYCNLLQGKSTNALAHVSNKSFKTDPVTGLATAERGGVCIMADDIKTLNLSTQTIKLFDFLIARLTLNFPNGVDIQEYEIDTRRIVSVSVREYMEICGLSDYGNAKKQLLQSLDSLAQIKLKWTELFTFTPTGAKKASRQEIVWETYVFDSKQDSQQTLKRGRAYLKLAYDLAKYYTQTAVIPHALKAFEIDNRKDPHAYRIFRKLEEHHAQNILKLNSNRISVAKLLEAAPDIPTYEEVRDGTNQVKALIIDRFEAALNSLQKSGLLKEWKYCNTKGAEITDKQAEDYSYKEWITWLIEFELEDAYPEEEQRERKERGKQKKEEVKKKKSTNNKKKSGE